MFRRIAVPAAPARRARHHAEPRPVLPPAVDRRPRWRSPMVALVVLAVVAAGSWWPSPAAAEDPGHGSANAAWVAASYDELLGRPADDGGLDYHLARIAAGGQASRQTLAYSLLFGHEGSRREVRRAYAALLDRAPDAAGDAYWTDHLTGRGVLDLRVLLVASDEYHRRAGGTDRAWLAATYRHLLGRAPDDAGANYWEGRLAAGVARADVAGAIHQSDEALARRADDYFGEILGRVPSQAERAAAVDHIRRHGERYLRARLWASDEAFESYLDEAWPS